MNRRHLCSQIMTRGGITSIRLGWVAMTCLLCGGVDGVQAEDLQPVPATELVQSVPADMNNPWPAAWERAFQERMRQYLDEGEHLAPPASWKSEKSGGGFMAFLKGRRASALAAMQIQAPDSGHTAGIDFYWCFHLQKQPRYYFQFGKFLPPEFMARMKEGAGIWTATDPRPNLELVLQLDWPDPEVAAHARQQLGAMWRSAEQVREMIEQSRGECKNGQPANKLAFASYLESILPQWPARQPSSTAEWSAWWQLLAEGDWKVYEEYERRTNPRPHPKYGIGAGPVGADWSPATRGGWVDWRNTDNLRALREVAIYLFAEETGNELVRKVYRERIRRTARSFYSVGNGEWDSPVYIKLTMYGYLTLYDFARDPETRLLAKGILDYLVSAAALKYFHGGASGPATRDYGVWLSGSGGSGSRVWSTWLPEPPGYTPEEDADLLYLSAYRPPPAVVALAGETVTKPWEILASHPNYSNWLPGADAAPAHHETLYRSREFQAGSMVEGGSGDTNGSKIVLTHPVRGFDYLLVTDNTKGNPCSGTNHRVAQCRNALVWASPSAREWRILIPSDTVVEREGDIVFLRFASSWAAVHPIRATVGEADPALVSAYGRKGNVTPQAKFTTILPLAVEPSDGLNGVAIEVSDPLHAADYAAFKKAVLAGDRVKVEGNKIAFAAASGARVTMAWDGQSRLPVVERDGQLHDWETHRALWQAGSTGPASVRLGWKEGRLTVEAGGHRFTGVMDLKSGTYSFENVTLDHGNEP